MQCLNHSELGPDSVLPMMVGLLEDLVEEIVVGIPRVAEQLVMAQTLEDPREQRSLDSFEPTEGMSGAVVVQAIETVDQR